MANYQFKVRPIAVGSKALKQAAITQVARYPANANVSLGVTFGTDGSFTGTGVIPPAAQVIQPAGTFHVPDQAEVITGAVYGDGSLTPGLFVYPAISDVLEGVVYGAAGVLVGNYHEPLPAEVSDAAWYGSLSATNGTLAAGGSSDVRPRNP